MKIIKIVLVFLLLTSIASAASMVSFDGKHITIYDAKHKVASVLTFKDVNDITTSGNYMYIATDNLCKIYNIATPTKPMGVNNFKPGADHIIAQKSLLFASQGKEFRVYDISKPTKPREMYKTVENKVITSIEPHGKYVILKFASGLPRSIKIG